MPHEDQRTGHALGEILLNQIGVIRRTPIRGRWWRIAEPGQIDQVNLVCVLEENTDTAKALAAAAPPVQEQDVTRRGVAAYLIDEGRSVVFEAFDVGCSARQSEGVSLTCALCALSKLSQR